MPYPNIQKHSYEYASSEKKSLLRLEMKKGEKKGGGGDYNSPDIYA